MAAAATSFLLLCIASLCLIGSLPGAPLLVSAQDSSSCTSVLTSLSPCFPYIQGSNTSAPATDCCTPLATVLKDQPTCVCQLAPLLQQSGTTVNTTRALEVVNQCKVTVPSSVQACLAGVIGAPIGSPTSGSPSGGSGASNSSVPGAGHGNGSLLAPLSTIAFLVIALVFSL